MNHASQEGHPSRVNLSIELQTSEGLKKLKLPHKILVLGDFSAGKSMGRIQSRKRYEITRETRDAVMSAIAPELSLVIQNQAYRLRFQSIHDFHPDALVKQVPPLSQLLAMRHLLKDLRSYVVENHEFKSQLNSMVLNESKREALMQEIEGKL